MGRRDYGSSQVIIDDGMSAWQGVALVVIAIGTAAIGLSVAIAVWQLSTALSIGIAAVGIGMGSASFAAGIADIIEARGRARAMIIEARGRARAAVERERLRALGTGERMGVLPGHTDWSGDRLPEGGKRTRYRIIE